MNNFFKVNKCVARKKKKVIFALSDLRDKYLSGGRTLAKFQRELLIPPPAPWLSEEIHLRDEISSHQLNSSKGLKPAHKTSISSVQCGSQAKAF